MTLRKTIDPPQIVCICDTREQTPLDVAPLQMKRGTLPTGDYSAEGFEHYIAIERKSLSDLVGCIGKERERFEKEVQRLLAYPVRALVVEANWTSIEAKAYRGEVHPNAVMGSLMGWIAQGLPVILIGDHDRAGKWVARMIYTAVRRRYEECYPFIEKLLA